MQSNSSPVPKLYLFIIDDVIERVQELFLEGLEDRVLEDLRKLWESKVKQSKTGEGFGKDTAKQQGNAINSSKFVLQLPESYGKSTQKPTAPIVTPAGQNDSFTAKNNPGTLATFSLPPGGTYPVQIPAGVTLQTASGQLYKINVPVMVTHAPGAHHPLIQPKPREVVRRCPIAHLPALVSTVHKTLPSLKTEQHSLPIGPARPITQLPEAKAMLPQSQGNHFPQPQVLMAQSIQSQEPLSVQSTWPFQPTSQIPSLHPDSPFDSEFTLDGIEFSPHPIDTSMQSSLSPKISDFQVKSDQTLPQESEFRANKIEEEEQDMAKVDGGAVADMAGNFVLQNMENLPEDSVKMDLLQDYNYNDLADIVQLDGPADSSSDIEEEEEGVIGENEFLGMINAEALKALQEADGSSDDGKGTSDSDGAEDEVEEEDPLNSGDDVSEQDIPDLFDTDNVIACQYDKIHRSKNRWRFYLKDGVMCFGGKDYVFSKAVGDAEW